MKTSTQFVLGLFALSAQAAFGGTTLLTDNFDDGNRIDTPNGGNWYHVGTHTVTFPGGASMNVSPGGNVSRSMQTTFSPASLAIGDSITASFDIKFTDTLTTQDRNFRVGLFNSAGTSLAADDTANNATTLTSNADNYGYWSGISTGPDNNGDAFMYYQPSGGNGFMSLTSTGAVNLTSDFNFGGINDDSTRTFTLTVARTATNYNFTFAVSGTLTGINPSRSVSRTYTGASTDTFDTFAIMTAHGSLDYTIDNMLVTVVPEPGTLGLLLISGLAFLLSRRNRTR